MSKDVKEGRVLTPEESAALTVDAKNRAVRTLWQGLAIDVLVAIITVIATEVSTAGEWGDLQWKVIGFTLMKTVVQTIAAFVMRRFLDPSNVPTPLPPTPQVPPADPLPPEITPDPEPSLPQPEAILDTVDESDEYNGQYPEELDHDGDGDGLRGIEDQIEEQPLENQARFAVSPDEEKAGE